MASASRRHSAEVTAVSCTRATVGPSPCESQASSTPRDSKTGTGDSDPGPDSLHQRQRDAAGSVLAGKCARAVQRPGHDDTLAPFGAAHGLAGDVGRAHPERVRGALLDVAVPGQLDELRPHRSGTQSRDGDSGAGELCAHRLAQREHERLRRGVRRLPRKRLEGGHGCDVQDRPPPAPHHPLDHTSAEIHHRLDVEADHRQIPLVVAGGEVPLAAEAGVVDEDLDVPARGSDLLDQPGALGGIREVAGDHLRLAAEVARDLLGEAPEALLAPRGESQVQPAAGELARDLGADARGGTGHQRGPSGGRGREAHSYWRPSRASRTRVTASGKTTRIASRTWIACSSLVPVRFIELIAATVISTASLIALSAHATFWAPCICSPSSSMRRRSSSGSPNRPPNPPASIGAMLEG